MKKFSLFASAAMLAVMFTACESKELMSELEAIKKESKNNASALNELKSMLGAEDSEEGGEASLSSIYALLQNLQSSDMKKLMDEFSQVKFAIKDQMETNFWGYYKNDFSAASNKDSIHFHTSNSSSDKSKIELFAFTTDRMGLSERINDGKTITIEFGTYYFVDFNTLKIEPAGSISYKSGTSTTGSVNGFDVFDIHLKNIKVEPEVFEDNSKAGAKDDAEASRVANRYFTADMEINIVGDKDKFEDDGDLKSKVLKYFKENMGFNVSSIKNNANNGSKVEGQTDKDVRMVTITKNNIKFSSWVKQVK